MPVTRRRILQAVTASSLALAGCAGGGDGGAEPPETTTGSPGGAKTTTGGADTTTSSGGATVVEMVNTTFDPVTVSVEPGTTVEWVNKDSYGHDVTAAQFHDAAADWSFSASVAAGGRASHTFEQSGVYEYYCTIHGKSTMCGAVVVGDASLGKSLPCQGGGGGGDY